MSKLDALKEKISALKTKVSEKTDKIAFLKAWKEKRATSTAENKAQESISLLSIYREGSTGTRLQVIAFYIFLLLALASLASIAKKVFLKIRVPSTENEQLVSNQFAEVQRKTLQKLQMISMGEFTANAYLGDSAPERKMSIDLWIRVNDPDAANEVNSRVTAYREVAMNEINDLYLAKVNLKTDDGKKIARDRILNALNASLGKGKVAEVFIYNFVVE